MAEKKRKNTLAIKLTDEQFTAISEIAKESGLTVKDVVKIFIEYGVRRTKIDTPLDTMIAEVWL